MIRVFLPIVICLFLVIGALMWFANPFSENVSGQAVAAETEPAAGSEQAENSPKPVDAWRVRCSEHQTPKEPGSEEIITKEHCEIFQRLSKQQTGQRFAEFAIGYPNTKEQDASGIVILPLGVLLERPVKMRVDEGGVYEFSFNFCKRDGCYARLTLPDDLVTEMKRGNTALIQFISANGSVMDLPISLRGFTKAINDLPQS